MLYQYILIWLTELLLLEEMLDLVLIESAIPKCIECYKLYICVQWLLIALCHESGYKVGQSLRDEFEAGECKPNAPLHQYLILSIRVCLFIGDNMFL